MTRLGVPLAAAVAALLLVAGCGGESKDDVIAEGDEICREANDKLEDLEEPESLAGLPDYAGEARPIVDDAVADLKALDAPDADREAFDQFIAKSEELAQKLEELEGAAPGTSEAELQKLNDDINRITDESNEAAAEYGFEACAEE